MQKQKQQNIHRSLLRADVFDLLLISVIGIPISISIGSSIEDSIENGVFFAVSLSILIGSYVFRDWNHGHTIGKNLFGVRLVMENDNLKRRKHKYATRNIELAFEMGFDLFLFRYRKRLKSINKKYGMTIKRVAANDSKTS